MVPSLCCLAFGLIAFASAGSAATLLFESNPLAGSPVLAQPGRQILSNETLLTFDPAIDELVINTQVFQVSDGLSFASGLAPALPMSGANFIVLQNGAPLVAGTAANAIAAQITQPTPGFFIYFNSGLNLARLVYSTNLDDPTADLATFARFTNLSTAEGFSGSALSAITAENVTTTPEPSSLLPPQRGFCWSVATSAGAASAPEAV
jgi:hypothetical protein